jgi:exodeoxyribonuclease V alpha subunit
VLQEDSFGELELQFSRWALARYSGRAPSGDSLFRLAAASLVYFARRGHLCADLSRISGTPVPPGLVPSDFSEYPPLSAWEPFFAHPSVSTGSGDGDLFVREPGSPRLYLDRLWRMETRVGQALAERWEEDGRKIPLPVPERFPGLFGPEVLSPDLSRAIHRALNSRLLVLTGGPGTGKTSAIVRLLLLFFHAGIVLPGRIRLSAPTGKAAQRLGESLAHFHERSSFLSPDEKAFLEAILQPTTVHRMIGFNARTGYSEYGSENPLKADLVVVDEMSMMELPLFDRLLTGTPAQAKMILVGDPGQLSSVGPGSVLGDLVAAGEAEAGPVVRLERSWRFSEESGIGRFSRMVGDGKIHALEKALWEEGMPGVEWVDLEEGFPPAFFFERVLDGYESYRSAENADAAFEALSGFRLLAVHREGERGVSGLSRRLERYWSYRTGILVRKEGPLGRPILILENDGGLDLSNGDIGIVPLPGWGDPESALFRSGSGTVRRIPFSLLPAHGPAFCMTVHKSQGSEFDTVFLILPHNPSPVLTRELLYTAITRARHRVVLFGNRAVFLSAIERRTVRFSGLSERVTPNRP